MAHHTDEFEAYRARSYSGGGFSSFRRRPPGLDDSRQGFDREAERGRIFGDGGVENGVWEKKNAGFLRRGNKKCQDSASMDDFLSNQSFDHPFPPLAHTRTDYHLSRSSHDRQCLPSPCPFSRSTPRIDKHSIERQLFFDLLFGKKSASKTGGGPNARCSPFQQGIHYSWILDDMRPRVASVPTKPIRSGASTAQPVGHDATINALNQHPLRKVRSFAIIGNRLVKESHAYFNSKFAGSVGCNSRSRLGRNFQTSSIEGEFRSSSGSSDASESGSSPGCGACTVGNVGGLRGNAEKHRVLLTGRRGVGKSAIVAQFLKSEWSTGNDEKPKADLDSIANESLDHDGYGMAGRPTVASILLDGDEATMEFIESTEHAAALPASPAAYVVVYSVEDRRSFQAAIDTLYELRSVGAIRQTAVILVANKVDLVRTRVVLEEEGTSTAVMYDCKYIEVSAAIDHHIDELFIGVLKQIRLLRAQQRPSAVLPGSNRCQDEGEAGEWVLGPWGRRRSSDSCCLGGARGVVIARLLRGQRRASKSCANLYVL